MPRTPRSNCHDFKGLGFSKAGHYKEVRSKIKELERLNVELARRHNKFEAIFNGMKDGLTILDRELTITFVNKVQKTMFPEVNLSGSKCYEAFYRRDRGCRECPAARSIESGESFRGELLLKKGELAGRYVEWTTSPIVDLQGEVSEVILIMRDVTERKEFEFKLMQTDRMAAIGLLASGIAHEINNPLTSIAGFSEGLLKRLSTQPELAGVKTLAAFREYLEIIQNEAHRCKDIIRKLSEFSRKSTDEHEILAMDEILGDTVAFLRRHAKDHSIRIVVRNHLAAGFNRIGGNESQLKHALLNLFHFFINGMEPGGELRVTVRNEGSLIEMGLSWTRTRGGMDLHEAMFDPSSPRGKARRPGTVNLSICYSIVRRHGGEIRLGDGADNGSMFALRFPSVVS